MSTQTQSQFLPDFMVKPRRYCLHNASPDMIDITWGGLKFVLPPVDAIGPKPARYPDDTPIPGTCIVQDSYCFDKEGAIPSTSDPPNWLAAEAIRNVLGIDPNTGEAVSPYARKGVSFIPENPTREQVDEVRHQGEQRYQEFMVGWADQTLTAYAEAAERARRVGVEPKPPGPAYQKALLIMGRYKDSLERTLKRETDLVERAADEEELEVAAYVKARAMKMAEKAAEKTNVDKVKLAEELLQDPDVRNSLKRGYSIRKRGFTETTSFSTDEEVKVE